jgi:hypothetical protein
MHFFFSENGIFSDGGGATGNYINLVYGLHGDHPLSVSSTNYRRRQHNMKELLLSLFALLCSSSPRISSRLIEVGGLHTL